MACRAVRRVHARLGRRGVFLIVIGLGEICWGVGYIVEPLPESDGLELLVGWCGLERWAWLWIIAGAAAVTAAFVRVGPDWGGFVGALLPPTAWATAYMSAAAGGEYDRGVFVAIWYLTYVGLIMRASAVPEHSVPPPPPRTRKGKAV